MTTIAPEILDAILARCTRAERAALTAALLPAWQVRERRLAERDGLLRGAAAMLEASARQCAQEVASAMRGTRRNSWPAGFIGLVQRARELNGDRPLGERQVAQIIAAGRTEDGVRKTPLETAHAPADSPAMEKSK